MLSTCLAMYFALCRDMRWDLRPRLFVLLLLRVENGFSAKQSIPHLVSASPFIPAVSQRGGSMTVYDDYILYNNIYICSLLI